MFGIGATELLIFAILIVLVLVRKAQPRWRAVGFAPGSRWSQFALKDLFASTALVAVGLAWIVIAMPMLRHSLEHLDFPVWLFVGGGAFLGAGALRLFKTAPVGALVGSIVQLALICSARSLGWPHF
jgi:hypothetical protein